MNVKDLLLWTVELRDSNRHQCKLCRRVSDLDGQLDHHRTCSVPTVLAHVSSLESDRQQLRQALEDIYQSRPAMDMGPAMIMIAHNALAQSRQLDAGALGAKDGQKTPPDAL